MKFNEQRTLCLQRTIVYYLFIETTTKIFIKTVEEKIDL